MSEPVPQAEAAPGRLPVLRLKRGQERRLAAGHLWVYSNEVDTAATPLGAFRPGEFVVVARFDGKPVGTAYVNPHALICARLVSRKPGAVLDFDRLAGRIQGALELRQALFDEPFYRLVYGEGDQLPGLVVDRYGDYLVVQLNTAGMEALRETIIEALVAVLAPKGILLRNDSPVRDLEGLPREVTVAHGEVPEAVTVREGGLAFQVDLRGGQKTGWFYDHRNHRARLARYVPGRRVLDLFSYVGAWSLAAARAGAESVLAVDSSAPALARLEGNAHANGLEERVATRQGDAFAVLKDLRDAGERFDVVVLDPPAFVKRKKDLEEGSRAYLELNRLAMQVLRPGGFLVSASCSFHFDDERLRRTLLRASRRLGRHLAVLERGGLGPDHPVHPAIPETDYLSCFFTRLG